MKVCIMKLFFGKKLIPIGEPFINQKTGTKISNFKKGSSTIRKVEFGEGNSLASSAGVKSIETTTKKDGQKEVKCTFVNSAGEEYTTTDVLNLWKLAEKINKKGWTSNTVYNKAKITDMLMGAMCKAK